MGSGRGRGLLSLAAGPPASARSINSELRRDRAEALAKAGTPAAN
jgi:hypothetical protein